MVQHLFVLFQSCSTGRAGCNNDSIELNSEHGSFGFKLNLNCTRRIWVRNKTKKQYTGTSTDVEQKEDVKEKQWPLT